MTTSTQTAHRPRKNVRKTILWTAFWVVVYVVGISLLSAIDGPDGKPWIEENILGETVRSLGLLASTVGPTLISVLRDTQEVKHEVKNDHSTNMRVENDSRHNEVLEKLKEVRKDVIGVRVEIRADREAVRDGFKAVNDSLHDHSERISRVEQRGH